MMSIKGYGMAENSWYKINVSSVYDFEIELAICVVASEGY